MKKKKFFSQFANWAVYVLLSFIVLGSILASAILINYLRKEEIHRIKLFAQAQKLLNEDSVQDPQVQLLLLNILDDNKSIPVIVADRFNNPVNMLNLPQDVTDNPGKVKNLLSEMEQSYKPLEIEMPDGNVQYIYYTNSRLMNNLRYYPLALGGVIIAYVLFSFWFLRTVQRSDEGFLWVGLAKETAHQIGTPLSSMIGWLEILRLENEDSVGVKEIEKDIQRLTTISERFSKIGSVPELNDLNLKETIEQNHEYLKTRISNKINFSLQLPGGEILIPHSRILINWVIENIVKNAVDAMKGIGDLNMQISEKGDSIFIDIKDNGSGMTKTQIRNAFKPGYSTKKRGWGLGLSLAKRVIKDYHNGDIKILQTEVGKGSTFRIILSRSKDA
ncbi:HAMP domain-containing sensor histidine kinase [Elizabethkingia occulta]|uniref:histidine kinase n=2 Tax=Elizabethkingia TaxID=308865 RepID=A0ABD5B527_ELIMR|nr:MULTISPECIES: HAMP domain-containing sensor histidine kinase [Elizabethkingia]KUG11046.1 histidine kinase [Elizabethkingia miricola]MCL1656463.1 HAMP domain-containing histidine kinase [Elizabethkingia miricola]MCL1668348.1 HAMP domain-containing histidine kinase [Elizabethkingia ursingii]MCP1252173.1 HAMP domain-containing histidine kinase [Elizabethkingia sp. S0634]MDQ8748840.1 HAMP domain-containing sensor histidine kinase [Elizabethkingia miricola]